MVKIPSKQTQEILPTSRHCFYASCVICRLMLVIVSSSPLSRSSETQAHPLGVPLSQRFAAEARVRFGYPKRCDTALKGYRGSALCKDVISAIAYNTYMGLTYDLLKDKRMDHVTINNILFPFSNTLKQIVSMLVCICPVIDDSRRRNVVTSSVTHSAVPRLPPCSYHILTSASEIHY